MTELSTREMSTKQFYEEIGGASLPTIRNHFLVLRDHGWIRKVKDEVQGPGRPRHVYRANEPAVFDDETWAAIPISIRDAFTAQLLFQLSERVAPGIASSSGHAIHITHLPDCALDESGWRSSIGALKRCYELLDQEKTEAAARLRTTSEEPTPMIVALAGFERHLADHARRRSADTGADNVPPAFPALFSEIPWNVRLAKVFTDSANLEIIELGNRELMSATRVAEVLGTYPQAVTGRFKSLVELGWIARVEERTGGHLRGAEEHYYCATRPAVTAAEVLNPVPPCSRMGPVWNTYREFIEGAVSAVQLGAFNTRIERHLTWNLVPLDDLGRQRTLALLRECSTELADIRGGGSVHSNPRIPRFNFFVAGVDSA